MYSFHSSTGHFTRIDSGVNQEYDLYGSQDPFHSLGQQRDHGVDTHQLNFHEFENLGRLSLNPPFGNKHVLRILFIVF